MPASLFIVSTPIGNLEDITLRALRVLKAVRTIAAEDTRHTGILLRHFGIQTPTTSLHEHNERQKVPVLLGKLARGEDVALVSDAGTPAVSDPGHRLIAAAIQAGYQVISVPGASAVLAALVTSGFPTGSFVFLGFPPIRSNNRITWFQTLANESRTVVFFEAPHRIRATLQDLSKHLVDRPISVGRELTKLHEEIIRGTAANLIGQLTKIKGEFTIVVSPALATRTAAQAPSDAEIWDCFCEITKSGGLDRRQAIAATAHRFSTSAKHVYAAVERMKHTSFTAADRGSGSA